MRRAVLCGLALLAFAGCNRETEQDRTVRKLQEAMKQPGPMGPLPHQTSQERLAALGSGQQQGGVLPLTVPGAPVEAGPLLYQVTGATEVESVGEGQTRIASDMPFVRVELSELNASGEDVQVDLATASLSQGKTRSGIAPDAQHLSGTRTTNPILAPHKSVSLVLYFEAPARKPPFTVNLPKPGGGEVQVPLK